MSAAVSMRGGILTLNSVVVAVDTAVVVRMNIDIYYNKTHIELLG